MDGVHVWQGYPVSDVTSDGVCGSRVQVGVPVVVSTVAEGGVGGIELVGVVGVETSASSRVAASAVGLAVCGQVIRLSIRGSGGGRRCRKQDGIAVGPCRRRDRASHREGQEGGEQVGKDVELICVVDELVRRIRGDGSRRLSVDWVGV